jgi:perosamine synthetase
MERIPFSEPNIGDLEKEYVKKALDSGWVGSKGDFIDKFEEKFAKYIGVDYAVTCSSGTTALQLAYLACGMQNRTVTVPKDTFIATKNMAVLLTPNVHEIDGDSDTWNIRLKGLTTDYVVGVHLYGNPIDCGQLYRSPFKLIEDCAQSLGSRHRWKKCGAHGIASTFSFHSAKMITTGEGGMVCTNFKSIADMVRLLKNQAMIEPYKHRGLGFNYRMTNLQAAMGLAQLERIDEFIDKKREATKFYNENLSDKFIRQEDTPHSFVVHWANAYHLTTGVACEKVKTNLLQSGIETRPGFIGDNTIVLPCSTKLTKENLEYVVREADKQAD